MSQLTCEEFGLLSCVQIINLRTGRQSHRARHFIGVMS